MMTSSIAAPFPGGHSTLERLRLANPRLAIRDLADPNFGRFGRVLSEDFSGLAELADRITDIDPRANRYVASLADFEAPPYVERLGVYFGLAEIQIGYCNGPNSRLNAVEWHKSAEIDIAVTDLVLLLGSRADIDEFGHIDSSLLECFFIPKGAAIELLPEVLHFSPCRAHPEGFKSVIVLPRGTNDALPPEFAPKALPKALPKDPLNATLTAAVPQGGPPLAERVPESRFLFMKNKWLIAHPERLPLVERGAFPGILGENIEISI